MAFPTKVIEELAPGCKGGNYHIPHALQRLGRGEDLGERPGEGFLQGAETTEALQEEGFRPEEVLEGGERSGASVAVAVGNGTLVIVGSG